MSERIERPSVVITGASSGIGEQCAYRFARAAARVSLIARRKDRLEAVAARVRELGGDPFVVTADVGSNERARGAVQAAESHFGSIDALVNNAGFGLYAPMESVPRQDLERLFAVNAFGALACTQAALPGMRRRNRGHIINVSSIVGLRALPMTGAYAATKFAMQAMGDALRLELRETGIEVSTICPGFTATEFSDHVLDYGVARRKGSGGMSAAAVAEVIFQCFLGPKRTVPLTTKGRLIVFINRVSPRLADFLIARSIGVRLPPIPEAGQEEPGKQGRVSSSSEPTQ